MTKQQKGQLKRYEGLAFRIALADDHLRFAKANRMATDKLTLAENYIARYGPGGLAQANRRGIERAQGRV